MTFVPMWETTTSLFTEPPFIILLKNCESLALWASIRRISISLQLLVFEPIFIVLRLSLFYPP